jgi:hypothetical protein
MKISHAVALLSATALMLCAIPAKAASNRTWVSGTGSDLGPCTIALPCATFQVAVNNTAAGGEVDCLTPGDFGGASGTLTISQSVSIVCDGVSNGGMLNATSGSTAITINAPSGAVVYLSGLRVNGLAGAGGTGVQVNSGSAVYIVHSAIQGFAGNGVWVVSTTNPTRIVIKDSILTSNGGGVAVDGFLGAPVVIMVNSVIDGNEVYDANGNGPSGSSLLALTRTLLTGSQRGLDLINGGAVLIGPSNTIAGAIEGTTTSAPFK